MDLEFSGLGRNAFWDLLKSVDQPLVEEAMKTIGWLF
jgi:hypothetical protein